MAFSFTSHFRCCEGIVGDNDAVLQEEPLLSKGMEPVPLLIPVPPTPPAPLCKDVDITDGTCAVAE